MPDAAYSGTRVVDFYDRLLERLERHTGIESAAAVFRLPVRQSTFGSRFRLEPAVDGEQRERSIGVQVVTPGYFETLGVGILRGRGLTPYDRGGAPPVVLINETAAKTFFPAQDPLGRRLEQLSYDPLENAAEAFTIVGIVADVRTAGLSEELEPEAYFSHAQVPHANMFIAMRTTGAPLEMARAVRDAIGAIDLAVPIVELRSMHEVVTESVARVSGCSPGLSACSRPSRSRSRRSAFSASSALRWRSGRVKSACESRSGQASPISTSNEMCRMIWPIAAARRHPRMARRRARPARRAALRFDFRF